MPKAKPIKETQLYGPVKAHFTALGYQVKGEIGAADLVAVPRANPEGEPVIVAVSYTHLTLPTIYSV